MKLSESYYRKVLDNLYDGIYFIDKDKKILYWNSGAEKHTGHKDAETIGRQCWDVLKHVDKKGISLCSEECPISKTIVDGNLREVDIYLHHKEGHLVPVSMRIAPIRDSNDQIVVAVEIYNEKSPRFRLNQELEELRNLALIDPLTEVGNRRYVDATLKGKFDELRRYGRTFGILFFDIDHFKAINDTHGHDMGDKVLKMVSKTVSNSLRSFDVIGRWGGEEFVVVLVNVVEEHLYPVSERLRLLVEHSSMAVDSGRVSASISIGATLARKDDSPETLVKRADSLMYRSKRAGRNCISLDEHLFDGIDAAAAHDRDKQLSHHSR